MTASNPTPADISAARERGRGVVLHTPVIPSAYLSQRFGGKIVLKAENLQRTGAFKIRGAMNKLSQLGNAKETGVVAGSAGNHAQGLALAAKHFGAKCEIFVPKGASLSKIAATKHHGATVLDGGESVDTAVAAALSRAKETGMAFCHPYDDLDVIAGQGTLGLELLEDIDDLELLIVPLGGGGLLSGTALAIKHQRPNVKIIGVQASICAPFIHDTFPHGQILTLADGIAIKRPGSITKPIIDKWVDDIIEVDEDSIADAVVLLMEHSKMLVEGGGAVGLSTLLTQQLAPASTGTTCIVLSGGNIDIGMISTLARRHETQEGRRLFIAVKLTDRPGELAIFLRTVGDAGANVVEVQHIREGIGIRPWETVIQLILDVRSPEHARKLLDYISSAGFHARELT
jgi:threonine dehydratase